MADASSAGSACVFTRSPTGWHQAAVLRGSGAVPGDSFGWAVAVSGGTVVVGAYEHAALGGRAYVFTKTATGWHHAAELKGNDTIPGDELGTSVAIAGATALVGSGGGDFGGHVYVFKG